MSYFQFGGNPVVVELLENTATNLDQLLDIQSFPAEFRNCNPKLSLFMDISKYNKLVQYITVVGDPNNRNRSYKYPMVAAEILSIDNSKTVQALLQQQNIMVQKVQSQEVWVDKQVDECDSQYYSSEGSNKESKKNADQFFQSDQQENIPPKDDKNQHRRLSSGNKQKNDGNIDNETVPHRKSMKATSTSVTLDDFPMVQIQKKIIRVKQIIINKKMLEIKPLFYQLCEYFSKQMNYTLTGYVVKVLELLYKKDHKKILKQIFTTKIYEDILKHIDSQCVCQLLTTLLLSSQNETQNGQKSMIKLLLQTLADNNSREQSNMQNKSILYILTQLVDKLTPITQKWHLTVFLSIFQFQSIYRIATLSFQQQTTNYNKDIYTQFITACIKKIINLNLINISNIQKITEEQNKKSLIQLIGKLSNCFSNAIDKILVNFAQIQKKCLPSSVYLRQLQLLNIVIKNNIYQSRYKLSHSQKLLQTLIKHCKKMNNNTFIHNQIFQLLKQIVHISDQSPQLFKQILYGDKFICFCLETIGQGKQKSSAMYKGQCIYLCEAIRHCSSPVALQFKAQHKEKWQKIEQAMLTNIQKMSSSLGGYLPKKSQSQSSYLLSKQQIFEKYTNFLRGEIPLKTNKNPNDNQLQQLDNKSLANEWNDWNEFSNYCADEIDEKNNEQKDKMFI